MAATGWISLPAGAEDATAGHRAVGGSEKLPRLDELGTTATGFLLIRLPLLALSKLGLEVASRVGLEMRSSSSGVLRCI